MPKDLNTPKYWNEVYEKESRWRDFNPRHWMNTPFYFRDNDSPAAFKEIVRLVPEGSKVLDVACGTGYLLQRIQKEKPTCVLTGIDYSEYVIELNRKRLKDIDFLVVDARNGYPKKQDKFDVIIFCEILEHLQEPGKIIDLFMSHLSPGGKVLCAAPNGHSIDTNMKISGTIGEHVQHWDKAEFEEFLQKHFKNVKVSKPGNFMNWALLAECSD